MDIDFRILVVLSPLLIAAGWALYNIGQLALQQARSFLNKQT